MKRISPILFGLYTGLSMEHFASQECAASEITLSDELRISVGYFKTGAAELITGAIVLVVIHPELVNDLFSSYWGSQPISWSSPFNCAVKYLTTVDLTDFTQCEYRSFVGQARNFNFKNQGHSCHDITPSVFYPKYTEGQTCDNKIKFSFLSDTAPVCHGADNVSLTYYPIIGLLGHGLLNITTGVSGIIASPINHAFQNVGYLPGLFGRPLSWVFDALIEDARQDESYVG